VSGTIYSGTSEIYRERIATLMGLNVPQARPRLGIYSKDEGTFKPYLIPDHGFRPVQEVVELDATAHERRA
jgi:hypothetical protein